MADKPILFSAPMIRALMTGNKTQTRRVLKPQPVTFDISPGVECKVYAYVYEGVRDCRVAMGDGSCGVITTQEIPYAPGDRLWVRESWSHVGQGVWSIANARTSGRGGVVYAADGSEQTRGLIKFWPSIHMPREFSRLTLIVEDVKIERLRDISEQDAIAEGATARKSAHGEDWWSMDWARLGSPGFDGKPLTASCMGLRTPQSAFGSFINELHDPKWNYKGDGIFGANPWVAAYTFRVVRTNIDQVPHG